MTIPSTAITIDGPTAWWVIDLETAWRRKHDNRPCDTCDGVGHVRQRLSDAPGIHRPVTCHDCHGTGRHCFTLDVEGECMSIANGRLRRYDGFAISVHVVAELEIGDDHTWGEGFLYGGKHLGPNWIVVGGGLDQPNITLPEDAAPGMYAVRLAVHT
jgi:hypothetical protein